MPAADRRSAEGGTVRLFIALELPTEARDALVRWREEAVGQLTGLRPIAPEHLHVTLCFLGRREAGEVKPIADVCQEVVGASKVQAELELGQALWLPPRRARVLAVELADRSGALREFEAALSAALARLGLYEPERRPFRPHVTVGRVRRGARPPAQQLEPPPPVGFTAATITLFRSRLSPAGARYEPLARAARG